MKQLLDSILRRSLSSLLVAAALSSAACGKLTEGGSDSSSHWLVSCEQDSQCDSGQSCLCGICTKECATTAECTGGDAASACARPEAACETSARFCAVTCAEDDDCASDQTCSGASCVASRYVSGATESGGAGGSGVGNGTSGADASGGTAGAGGNATNPVGGDGSGAAGNGTGTGGVGNGQGGVNQSSGGNGGAGSGDGGANQSSGGQGGATNSCDQELPPFPVVCSEGTPVVVDDIDTGYVRCENSATHRAAKLECPQLIDEADPASCTEGSCTTSADCGERELCTAAPAAGYCNCTDLCHTDADCGAGEICQCGSVIGVCVAADCTEDADCPEGQLCLLAGSNSFSCHVIGTVEEATCPTECDGACGCDGVAYCNECQAHQGLIQTTGSLDCIPGNGVTDDPCGNDDDCQTDFICCRRGPLTPAPGVCAEVCVPTP